MAWQVRQPWQRINWTVNSVPYIGTSARKFTLYVNDASPSSEESRETAATEMSQPGGKTCNFDWK